MDRGSLIVLEGLDACGKTTQATALVKLLAKQGIEAVHLQCPSEDSPFGKLLARYLAGDTSISHWTAHTLFSSCRWDMVPDINAHLALGITVILERWAYSGIAYSLAKGMSAEWVSKQDNGLPKPDQVFLLKISPKESMKRMGLDSETLLHTLGLVSDNFDMMSEEWVVIEATHPPKDITHVIHSLLTTKVTTPTDSLSIPSLEFVIEFDE